jgi:uncharacterized coiled-coil DUF342 family protein
MKLSTREKFTFGTFVAALLVLAVWAVGWDSLRRFGLGGEANRAILRLQTLNGDAQPPPLFFVEGSMHLQMVANSPDSAVREANWKEFHKHRKVLEEAVGRWDSILVDDPGLAAQLHAFVNPVRQTLERIDDRFSAAYRSGDRTAMQRILQTEYIPAYNLHDSLADVFADSLATRISSRVDSSREAIAGRFRFQVGVLVAVLLLFGFGLVLVRRFLRRAVVFEQVARNVPVNVLMAGPDLVVNWANERSLETLRKLEHSMHCKANEVVGRSIDIFHEDPGRIRSLLGDPANLPHSSTVRIGEDYMHQDIVAVVDEKGRYLGPMLSWQLVTDEYRRRLRDEDLQATLAEKSKILSSQADEMNRVSESIRQGTEVTSQRTHSSSEASEQVGRSLEMMASSAEEMSASVGEISRNMSEASRVADQAGAMALDLDQRMQRLGASSKEISQVVGKITDVADQTNLLALNATIEAARAGEEGKGFAVVAGEVKALAKQTGQATDDIERMIASIQAEISSSVGAIGKVTEIVRHLGELQSSIAAAVEEQNATAREIAQRVVGSAQEARTIVDSLEELKGVALESAESARRSSESSSRIAQMASDLDRATAAFSAG